MKIQVKITDDQGNEYAGEASLTMTKSAIKITEQEQELHWAHQRGGRPSPQEKAAWDAMVITKHATICLPRQEYVSEGVFRSVADCQWCNE